jgi:CRP-like cAMP-binding protein
MADTTIQQQIAEQQFLVGMKSEFTKFLADHAQRRSLDRDEILFRYDTEAEHFHLVVSGKIAIEVAAIEGPPLELQELGPGAILGWSWLIPPYRWHFQARAKDTSEIIEFDGQAVRDRCESDAEFGYEILKRFSALMSERLSSAREQMMEEWSPPGFA